MTTINNETIKIALAVQALLKKGYAFKMVSNTIEIMDSNGCCDYYPNNDFKKWILSEVSA